MERRGSEVHLSEDEARGGSTPHILRFVLIISLALAIVAMSAVWITGALTGGGEDEATADQPAMAQDVPAGQP